MLPGCRANRSVDLRLLVDYSISGLSKPGDRSPKAGGKSELHRAGRWVTPRRGDPTESATETHRQRLATRLANALVS